MVSIVKMISFISIPILFYAFLQLLPGLLLLGSGGSFNALATFELDNIQNVISKEIVWH